jgi:hypothetical protein
MRDSGLVNEGNPFDWACNSGPAVAVNSSPDECFKSSRQALLLLAKMGLQRMPHSIFQAKPETRCKTQLKVIKVHWTYPKGKAGTVFVASKTSIFFRPGWMFKYFMIPRGPAFGHLVAPVRIC